MENLRKGLGLSQREMAFILQMSESLYSKVEKGQRKMPKASSHILQELEFRSAQGQVRENPIFILEKERHNVNLLKELSRRIQDAEYEIGSLRSRLKQMIGRFDKARRALEVWNDEPWTMNPSSRTTKVIGANYPDILAAYFENDEMHQQDILARIEAKTILVERLQRWMEQLTQEVQDVED